MLSVRLDETTCFPETPLSHRCTSLGERTARPRWCRLTVEIEGIALQFVTPGELDHMVGVLLRQPPPRSIDLSEGRPLGPDRHWPSRLPAKAKTTKFRARFLKLVERDRQVARFREIHAADAA